MRIQHFLVTAALATLTMAASALPTVDAVQAELKSGNYAQAEVMMQEVVTAKPGSARARYIYAEILAHNRRFDAAASEVARARQIDPLISFADGAKFKAFEQLLEREQQAAKPRAALAPQAVALPAAPRQAAPAEPTGGVPSWVWALGLGGVAAAVWGLVSRRRQAAASPMGNLRSPLAGAGAGVAGGMAGGMAGGATGGMGAYGPGYGAGPAPGFPQAAAGGNGLMGIGLAAAGGVAAGMLAEKLLHGGHDTGNTMASAAGSGGLVPGLFDPPAGGDAAARELEQRQVDFGNGDGWGGDNGGGGGGSDDSSDGW